MKKAFLIVAMAFISLMAAAQDLNSVYYEHDTITMQEMMIEMATLNNQIRSSRNMQLAGITTTLVGGGISLYSSLQVANLAAQTPTTAYYIDERDRKLKNAKIASWVGYGATFIGTIMWITGIAKLPHDRLEITPNGVIIKLTPYK